MSRATTPSCGKFRDAPSICKFKRGQRRGLWRGEAVIHYILPDAHDERARARLEPRAAAHDLPIEVIPYSRITGSIHFPSAVLIFAGLESVSLAIRERAARLWRALAAVRVPLLLLNHPLLAMQRYELLRQLHERGINDFDVYRLTEARRPRRFPVFLRDEDRPLRRQTRLLATDDELEAAWREIVSGGLGRDTKLIVEFGAARDARGRYVRYGAYSINGAIVPCRPVFHDRWLVRAAQAATDSDLLVLEREHLAANPHAAELRRIFQLARIDFGRIDYTLVGGRIQVYGIHTDPIGAAAGEGENDAGGESPNPDLDRLVAGMTRLLTVLGEMQKHAASLTR